VELSLLFSIKGRPKLHAKNQISEPGYTNQCNKMVRNKAFIYKNLANGWPVAGQDLTIEDIGFDENAPPPSNGFTTKNVSSTVSP
jgi:hypothetical protein